MLRRCASVALHCETVSINACVYAHSTVPSVNLCCTVKLLCETKQAIPCYCEIHTLYQCFYFGVVECKVAFFSSQD